LLVTGRYRLVESIGQGGMGRVWRAADEMLDRQVAVKEMRIDGLDPEDTRTRRERTLREARATARIDHPNVVRVYDVVDEGERLWIVMELVAGRSLEQMVMQDGPLGVRETARIGLGLVAALSQVHAGGVLHRDIKPGNVLVERDGRRVVLTDFGIAAIQDAKALTMVGMLVGSPDYMAPERISGRPQGPPSDVWSLGATLCAALGGRSPFSRSTTLATLHAVLYDEPELPPGAGELRDVLAALLEKEPSVRPSLDDVELVLRPIAFPEPRPTRSTAPLGAHQGAREEGDADGNEETEEPGDAGVAGEAGGAGESGEAEQRPEAERRAEAAGAAGAVGEGAGTAAPGVPEQAPETPGAGARAGVPEMSAAVPPGEPDGRESSGAVASGEPDRPERSGEVSSGAPDRRERSTPPLLDASLVRRAQEPSSPSTGPAPADAHGKVGDPGAPEAVHDTVPMRRTPTRWDAPEHQRPATPDVPSAEPEGTPSPGTSFPGTSSPRTSTPERPEPGVAAGLEPGVAVRPEPGVVVGPEPDGAAGPQPGPIAWPEPAGATWTEPVETAWPESAGTVTPESAGIAIPESSQARVAEAPDSYAPEAQVPLTPEARAPLTPEAPAPFAPETPRPPTPETPRLPTPEPPAPSATPGHASSESRSEGTPESPSPGAVRVPSPGPREGETQVRRAQVAQAETKKVSGRPPASTPCPVPMSQGDVLVPPVSSAPRHSRRRMGLAAAGGVIVAGAVVGLVIAATGGSPDDKNGADSPSSGLSTSASSPPSTSASSPPSTSASSPPSTVDGTSRPPSLPPGARKEGGVFAWVPPEGWDRVVESAAYVNYTSPDGGQEIIGKASLARGELMDWWEKTRQKARQGLGYQEIRFERTTFRGVPAVAWEYTVISRGKPWHCRLLGFNTGGKSYQISTWYHPDIEATAVPIYEKVRRSFTVL